MIGVIAEHVKTHRHELGKHALFIGSSVRIPPRDQMVQETIEQIALKWAGDQAMGLDQQERAQHAVELLAAGVPDHAERCQMLKTELTADMRAAEGHVRLSRLIKDGYYSHIFITEPTNLLERALRAQHMEPGKDYHLLVAGVDDPNDIRVAISDSSRLAIVKCGGDLEQKFLPLAQAEMEQVAVSISDIVSETCKLFTVFVAMAERDDPFLKYVPREGARIFWINPIIPMGDARLYDELKLESPASADFHRLQPHIIALLEARHSSRHLLCREPGTFNEFFAKLHQRLIRQRHGVRGKRRDLTVLRGGPYRFLNYFDLEDEEFFFGREEDVKVCIEKIREHPITVITGRSGTGKTSLLRAGIMAGLRKETEAADKEEHLPWLCAFTRVGEDPVASVRNALLGNVRELGYDADALTEHECLCELINNITELTKRQVVVILDQFAEFFARVGATVQTTFRETLQKALENCGGDFRLVITIREDYLGELYELSNDFPTIFHNLHRLKKLTREQAEDAILKPAQNFELQVERGLMQRVIDDLNRNGVDPLQLQVVCHALYEARSRGSWVLSERLYDKLGGAQEIVDKYLERVLVLLPSIERKQATRILVFLAGTSELVAAHRLDRIVEEAGTDRETVERILAHLVDLGLLRPVGKGRWREWELMHEALGDKIQAELAGKQMLTRDVHDVISRAVSDYLQFGLTINSEDLKLIDNSRDDLTLGNAELQLVVRSSLTQGYEINYWFGRVTDLGTEKSDYLSVLMGDDNQQVRLETYTHLATHLEPRLIRQLVRGLDDDQPEIRALAATYLSQVEAHLIAMLQNPDARVRTLAARALGRMGTRKAVKPLTEAFLDGADDLRDELTEALRTVDNPKTMEMLLREVITANPSNWAAAYGLGMLSVGEEELKILQKSAGAKPRADILFALAITWTQRRSFPEAAEALATARRLTQDRRGHVAIGEAEELLEEQRSKSAEGEDSWLMFAADAVHSGVTDKIVTPPLELVWEFVTKDHVVASPVVRDNTVYIGSRDKKFYAVDTGKGTARWSFDAPERVEGAAAIINDLVCFATLGGTVHALHVASGEQVWKVQLDSPVRSSLTVHDNGLLVGTRSGQVVSIDVEKGRTRWIAQASGEVASTPACGGELVIVGCWDGHIMAFNSDTGLERWRVKTQGPVSSSPAIADGTVFCGSDDQHLYALVLGTGEQIWKTRLRGQIRCCPALTSELVVVGALDGKCYAMLRKTGEVRWMASTQEEILASPAVAQDVVYIGSRDGGLYAFDLATGEELWKHMTAYGIYSSPAIAEETVFIGLDYYNLAAFRPKTSLFRRR